MTQQLRDGGPAFPNDAQAWALCPRCNTKTPGRAGMSLRDHFAGQALSFWAHANIGGWAGDFPKETAEQIARQCYIIADAMLAARERKESP